MAARRKLKLRLRDVVGNVGFDEAVTKILDHLNRQEGPLTLFIKEMCKARPTNSKVQAVCRTCSSSLFSQACKNELDIEVKGETIGVSSYCARIMN